MIFQVQKIRICDSLRYWRSRLKLHTMWNMCMDGDNVPDGDKRVFGQFCGTIGVTELFN